MSDDAIRITLRMYPRIIRWDDPDHPRHKEQNVTKTFDELDEKVQRIAERLNRSIGGATALEARVARLETSPDRVTFPPYDKAFRPMPEPDANGIRTVQLTPEDTANPGVVWIGEVGYPTLTPHGGTGGSDGRRGPPPGVPDPTTARLEQLTKERDRAALDARQLLAQFDSVSRSAARLTEERDIERARVLEVVRERDAAMGHGEATIADIARKLEHATKRAQLADAEWNAARVAINPLIAKEFDGQTLVDAVTHTIQMLEAKLKSAHEAGRRAHDDAQRIQKLLAAQTVTQEQLDNFMGAMADQAVQVMELRAIVQSERENGAAALHRQASTWEHARKEGQEQNRRLIEETSTLRADRDRVTGLLSSATSLLEDVCRAIGVSGGLSREQLVERTHAKIVEVKATIERQAESCRVFRDRIVTLEQQAERRDKLTQTIQAQAGELRDHLYTIADEAFGPFPVLTTEQTIEAIGAGITRQRFARQRGDRLYEQIRAWLYEQIRAWLDNERGIDGVREALAAYDKDQAEWQIKDEAAQLEFLRRTGSVPDEDDCQAGTCDCPSRPGTYDVAHNDGCPNGCTCGPLAAGGEHKIGCPEMPF